MTVFALEMMLFTLKMMSILSSKNFKFDYRISENWKYEIRMNSSELNNSNKICIYIICTWCFLVHKPYKEWTKIPLKCLTGTVTWKLVFYRDLKPKRLRNTDIKDSNRMDLWKQFFELPLSFVHLFSMRFTFLQSVSQI